MSEVHAQASGKIELVFICPVLKDKAVATVDFDDIFTDLGWSSPAMPYIWRHTLVGCPLCKEMHDVIL